MDETDRPGWVVGLRRLGTRALSVFGFGQGRNGEVLQIIAAVFISTGTVSLAYRQWPDKEDYVLVVGFTVVMLGALARHRASETDPWNA